ncbi:Collectin-12 Collectin placenta protein 1 [Triplophysa tibetana]|uniref:Collectin-12 Collectin placenta protein 1 n=1 Tax=Triplophysa tibetana TaxID=1572043 RepID=A0A5A9PJ05_9TELE|nr:Collectin-12 Collectin placenta protein 1 [Triplophysa tibetana]
MDMDLGVIYENMEPKNRNTAGPQSQNPYEAQNRKRSRGLVVITVCLGIFCVFLVLALLLLCVFLTGERDQLQQNITSVKEHELETKVYNLTNTLKEMFSGSLRYFLSSEEKNWTDSRRFCKDQGGNLVIIKTEEEQRFISSLVDVSVWIGLSDTEEEGNMKWVDNTPLTNRFWIPGEPTNQGNNEDCVVISEFSKKTFMNWNDLPCSWKIKCICEK